MGTVLCRLGREQMDPFAYVVLGYLLNDSDGVHGIHVQQRRLRYRFLLTSHLLSVHVAEVSVRLGIRIWNGCIYLIDDHGGAFDGLIFQIVLDSLALTTLLYKSLQHARFIKNLSGEGVKVSILTVMAHDGIEYFILNLLCTLTNMIGLRRFPANLHGFLFTTQSCVQNALCARLFFHLQIVNDGWTTNATGFGVNTNNFPIEMKAVASGTIKFAETSVVGMECSVKNSMAK